ncbi:MAG: hypothetical protein KME16_21190 [Scytolyngbya sp. HA4215-MV1]|nr:hypothetical protein [Scytolyngbya sp. HA4215-MV1]
MSVPWAIGRLTAMAKFLVGMRLFGVALAMYRVALAMHRVTFVMYRVTFVMYRLAFVMHQVAFGMQRLTLAMSCAMLASSQKLGGCSAAIAQGLLVVETSEVRVRAVLTNPSANSAWTKDIKNSLTKYR